MQKKVLNISMLLFTASSFLMLSGCSGHGLQDWADETFNNKENQTNITKEDVAVKQPQVEEKQSVPQQEHIPETPTEVKTVALSSPVVVKPKNPTPSQNPALNAVSPSVTATSEGEGIMQKKLDPWVEEEWSATVEKNSTIKELNEDEDRPFTIQEYVDKAGVYLNEKEKQKAEGSQKPSHVQEMEHMPAIGK